MKSLLVSGISGQVGSHIQKLASKYSFNLVCGVDRKRFSDADCPVYNSFSEVKENIDLIIDFSSPALLEEAIDFSLKKGCKLVSGTTALLTNQISKLKELSKITAVCHSNNFSKSVVPFIWASEQLKNSLGDFDCVLVEEHNKNKKDAPSGTAKQIADRLNIDQIHPIRGGSVSGVHKILFLGMGEEIEITHRAYEKSVFARGALYCAQVLMEKEKGLYTVESLFNGTPFK